MARQEIINEGALIKATKDIINQNFEELYNSPVIAEAALSDTITVDTDKKIQLRDTGNYIQSPADGKVLISADGAGADDITLSGTVTITDTLTMAAAKAIALSAAGFTMAAIARTATADGLTTGIIAPGPKLQHVTVTSANAAHIIALPTPTVGDIVVLFNASNGYELRSSAPATISINGGADADAESAIPAGAVVIAFCVSPTAWLALQIANDGTVAGVEAAAAS